jgi:hypothetical protein
MASSAVEIVNSALNKLGASTISSLGADSKEAILANQQYDIIRQELLRSHPWNFAIARVSLAQTGNTPAFEYDYEYVIPSDVLRILDVEFPEERFVIEHNPDDNTRVILTNNSTMKIKYIKDVEDVTKFDANFCEVFSARLAAEFAFNLTGKTTVMEQMYNLYETLLRNARSFDAQEGTPPQVTADLWINQRY